MMTPYAERFRRRYGIRITCGGPLHSAVRTLILARMRAVDSAERRSRFGPLTRTSGTVEWYLAELDDMNARPYWGRVLRKLRVAERRVAE